MNNPSTCPHFAFCSGCNVKSFLHPPIWKEVVEFFESYGVKPKFIAEGFSGTRMKAKLAVRPGPKIGLFKKNTHEVIPIPHCLVHHPSINQAIKVVESAMCKLGVSAYNEITQVGSLRYIQLFVAKDTGKIQLTLVINERQKIHELCNYLKSFDLWHSIWINTQNQATNQILGSKWELIFGEKFLWQKLYKQKIPFHPGAFSQVHLSLFEKMLEKIESWVDFDEKVLELYAGVGAIGLNLADRTHSVTFVENNPFSYLCFQQTKSPLSYFCEDAKNWDLSGYDTIIVDPPRKGLDQTMLPRFNSKKLIYVSCGFESFKKDAKALIDLGWKLSKAEGYLLFSGTNHVEILAFFER